MQALATRNLLKHSIEIPLVLVLVTCAFLLLWWFLNWVFPLGTPLSYMLNERGLITTGGGLFSSERSLAVEYNGEYQALETNTEIAASLASIRRVVKRKPANRIAWASARAGMHLYSRDAVQTFSKSEALIRFDEENYIDMGENSLVIIKQISDDPLLREKLTRILVFAGELRGKLSATSGNRMQMEIRSKDAVTRITAANKDKATLFKYKINPDKTSTVTVLEGEASLIDKGQKIQLNRFEAYTITPGDTPADIKTPPDEVRAITPKHNAEFHYNELPPKVNFSWRKQSNADTYTLQVARDAAFNDIITAEQLKKTYFVHGNMKAGDYYWRVRGQNGWAEGPYSKARKFNIAQDNTPPLLQVIFPADTTGENALTLQGETESGSRVFVNNKPVKVDSSGAFEHQLLLNPGPNTIVVEAVDTAGNSTYQSKMINFIKR